MASGISRGALYGGPHSLVWGGSATSPAFVKLHPARGEKCGDRRADADTGV